MTQALDTIARLAALEALNQRIEALSRASEWGEGWVRTWEPGEGWVWRSCCTVEGPTLQELLG